MDIQFEMVFPDCHLYASLARKFSPKQASQSGKPDHTAKAKSNAGQSNGPAMTARQKAIRDSLVSMFVCPPDSKHKLQILVGKQHDQVVLVAGISRQPGGWTRKTVVRFKADGAPLPRLSIRDQKFIDDTLQALINQVDRVQLTV
jgi:hypothetical protein